MNNRGHRKTPEQKAGHQKKRTIQAPSAPAASSPFDVEKWKVYWKQIEVANQQVKEASSALKAQPQDSKALATLRLAVDEKFNVLREMYIHQHGKAPEQQNVHTWWNIERAYELLRRGDVAELGTVIRFLEDDPWFHGSGYLKENLIPAIKPSSLCKVDAKRLAQVCLSITDKRDGREFRAFCHLARKVDAPELRQALTQRLTHTDSNIRRRARWMLDALEQPR